VSTTTTLAGPRHGFAWVIVIGVIALAGAGLVVALDHTQSDRPELTARGDALVAPRLDALGPGLSSLADASADLASRGRAVLEAMRAFDPDRTREAVAAGDAALATALQAAGTLAPGQEHLMDGVSVDHVSGALRQRAGMVGTAVDAASQLPAAWDQIAGATAMPTLLMSALGDHDRLVLEATDAARASHYDAALASLTQAGDALTRVNALRDKAAAAGKDVSTLDGWSVRLSDYDAALTHLYRLMVASGGIATPDTQAALAQVDAAHAALPRNNDALLIIVDDIGGQDLTRGLLAIEEARGPIDRAADR
jgi:hypothetical protein